MSEARPAPSSYPREAPEAGPRVISFVRRGEIVFVLNSVEQLEPMLVLTRCDARHRYYCATCHTLLDDFEHVERHVEAAAGTHTLATICQRHGTPEAALPEETEQLGRFQQIESGL